MENYNRLNNVNENITKTMTDYIFNPGYNKMKLTSLEANHIGAHPNFY